MDSKGSTRNYIEYAAVRSLTAGLGWLPRSAAVGTGRVLGRLAYYGFGRLRQIGRRNLRIAMPHLNAAGQKEVLRGCFDSLGRQLGEFSHFQQATAGSLKEVVEYDSESLTRLEEAKSRARGILFVTAHLGGWEVLAFAHSALMNPISILARPIENPRVDRMVHAVRTRFGNEIIDKKAAGLTCMRILKKGGTLGILADLNSLPQEGAFVPFFGHLACTTLAVSALALASEAVVFPVFAPWDPGRKKYVFRGGPVVEILRTGDHEKDLGINTARILSVIEKTIREYPDQWLWIHDRWHALVRPGDRICIEFPPV